MSAKARVQCFFRLKADRARVQCLIAAGEEKLMSVNYLLDQQAWLDREEPWTLILPASAGPQRTLKGRNFPSKRLEELLALAADPLTAIVAVAEVEEAYGELLEQLRIHISWQQVEVSTWEPDEIEKELVADYSRRIA